MVGVASGAAPIETVGTGFAAFDLLPVAAFVCDAVGRIVYANPSLHRLLGADPGSLVGGTADRFDETSPDRCAPPATAERSTRDACYRRADGTLLWVSESTSEAATEDGSLLQVRIAVDLSPYRRAEAALRDQLLIRETLFETLPLPVFLKDLQGRFTDCNGAFERFTGVPRSALTELTAFSVMEESMARVHDAMDRDLAETWGRRIYEEEVPHADGSRRLARISKAVFCTSAGQLGGIVGVIHDLSEGLPDRERLDTILEQSPIGVSVSRRDTGLIIFANTRFAQLVGLPRQQIVGSPARGFYVDAQQRMRVVQRLKEAGSVVNMEVQFRRADGSSFWTLFTVNQAVIAGAPVNLAWIYDYTERRNMEEALRDMASKDPLTGIYNRRSFMELAGQQLSRTERYGEPLSVMVLDVDHFKRVNDTHGHAVGDEALRLVAGACGAVLRDYDILGRLGGEEFVIALPGATPDESKVVAERVRRHIARMPIPVPGGAVKLTASIGIAGFEGPADSLEKAIHRADLALYRAKNAGRNRVVVHQPCL